MKGQTLLSRHSYRSRYESLLRLRETIKPIHRKETDPLPQRVQSVSVEVFAHLCLNVSRLITPLDVGVMGTLSHKRRFSETLSSLHNRDLVVPSESPSRSSGVEYLLLDPGLTQSPRGSSVSTKRSISYLKLQCYSVESTGGPTLDPK